MPDDKTGMELHQKQFRGEALTEREKQELSDWYAEQDQMETAALNITVTENTIHQLRGQITEVLNQLTQLTQRIQQIAQENDKIRQENARLFQLLIKKSESQAA
jgi:hypothetical protein